MVEGLILAAAGAAVKEDPFGTNRRTMKKTLFVLALIVAGAALLTSCNKHQSCPAYGKVHKVPTERA